jgi:hypothetical protein
VLNSLALKQVGISKETPDPQDGLIERDIETGEPTGLLYRMGDFLSKRIPPLEDRQLEYGVKMANRAQPRRQAKGKIESYPGQITYQPDKIPIDLGGNQSGINIIAYRKLLDYLDISDSNIRFCDYVQQLVLPCEDLLQRFEVDIRWIRP